MIDLSYKPKQPKQKEEPLGIVMLALVPFVAGFWWILTQGFVSGIY